MCPNNVLKFLQKICLFHSEKNVAWKLPEVFAM